MTIFAVITTARPALAAVTFQGLGYLSGGTYGNSRANAVSADGSVVVGEDDSGARYRAWRWTAATGMVQLKYPGVGTYTPAVARAVSADGSRVAGSAVTATPLAWRWTSGPGFENVGALPGESPTNYYDMGSTGISADGSVIVGNISDGGSGIKTAVPRVRAFRWTSNQGMVRIGSGNYTVANAISADGSTIVGQDQNFGAFRWTAIYEQAVVKSERVDSGGLNSNHLFGVSRRGDAPYLLMRG